MSAKVGDRVKVEFTGTVEVVNNWSGRMQVSADSGQRTRWLEPEHVTVIEPEYEKGSVYVSAGDEVYYRLNRSGPRPWRHVGSTVLVDEDFPERPLRKLVPEGE